MVGCYNDDDEPHCKSSSYRFSAGRHGGLLGIGSRAAGKNPRVFDLSISANAAPGMNFPDGSVESFIIRGYPAGTTLARAAARDWLRRQTFHSGLFSFSEVEPKDFDILREAFSH